MAFGISACRSRESTESKSEAVEAGSAEKLAEQKDIKALDPDEPPIGQVLQALPHPVSPSAWNTKSLLLTSQHPDEARLLRCHNEILAIGKNALSADTILWSRDRVAQEIATNGDVYHWCFYNSLMLIDNKLSNDGLGILAEQKSQNYALAMRSLWILAVALDKVSGAPEPRYFNYLRARYLQLSKEYFGRDVDVIGKPFNRDLNLPSTRKKAGEAADL